MKKKKLEMGEYYYTNLYGLIRTICRATTIKDNIPMIAFVKIQEHGFASEIFLLPEHEFQELLGGYL